VTVASRITVPEPSAAQLALVNQMRFKARQGWYIGTEETLVRHGAMRDIFSATNPHELGTRLILTRDRMHHSVGWWRNADYECCWHLSISCRDLAKAGEQPAAPDFEPVSHEEEVFWGRLFFGEHARWVWYVVRPFRGLRKP
jgi:hypothetical protein